MFLNTLKPAKGSRPKKNRVGRGMGSGSGKTCGHGHKGQKSRSGASIKPGFEGGQMPLQRRVPKFGFSSRVSRVTEEIRTSELNGLEAEIISIDALKGAGLVKKTTLRARIMLSGDVTKKVKIDDQNITVSKGAREAIEKAGGEIASKG